MVGQSHRLQGFGQGPDLIDLDQQRVGDGRFACPGMADDGGDLAGGKHQVEVVASLPCYSKDNVDKQRGKGVFNSSIIGLQCLNKLGYGKNGTGKVLNLMYNPGGTSLPPSQAELEADYKRQLKADFDIVDVIIHIEPYN